jgi:RNA polymerase subunit RPABC4/transcription elongation factor Spt4
MTDARNAARCVPVLLYLLLPPTPGLCELAHRFFLPPSHLVCRRAFGMTQLMDVTRKDFSNEATPWILVRCLVLPLRSSTLTRLLAQVDGQRICPACDKTVTAKQWQTHLLTTRTHQNAVDKKIADGFKFHQELDPDWHSKLVSDVRTAAAIAARVGTPMRDWDFKVKMAEAYEKAKAARAGLQGASRKAAAALNEVNTEAAPARPEVAAPVARNKRGRNAAQDEGDEAKAGAPKRQKTRTPSSRCPACKKYLGKGCKCPAVSANVAGDEGNHRALSIVCNMSHMI